MSDVYRLGFVVRLLNRQLVSHMVSHKHAMLLSVERSIAKSLEHVFRSSAVIAPTLSCMCLTQHSCQLPLQDREWNRLAFFVSLGAMSPTIGDACSTTDRGLNLWVTGVQQRRSFARSAQQPGRTTDVTSTHALVQLLDVSVRGVQASHLVFQLVQRPRCVLSDFTPNC